MAESLPGQRFRLLQETARWGQAERASYTGREAGWPPVLPQNLSTQVPPRRMGRALTLANHPTADAISQCLSWSVGRHPGTDCPRKNKTCWTATAPDGSNVHSALGGACPPGRSAFLRDGTSWALRLWLQKRDLSRRTMEKDAQILSQERPVLSVAVAALGAARYHPHPAVRALERRSRPDRRSAGEERPRDCTTPPIGPNTREANRPLRTTTGA